MSKQISAESLYAVVNRMVQLSPGMEGGPSKSYAAPDGVLASSR